MIRKAIAVALAIAVFAGIVAMSHASQGCSPYHTTAACVSGR